jgi:DNA-binding transcriptional MerR regulator
MKTGKVADMLGVDQKTITNWVDRVDFEKFFSPEARGKGRSMGRLFDENEIVILNTIRLERQKNTDWPDIARLLDNGVRDTNLPVSALLVDSPAPLVQYGKMQVLQARVEELEQELTRKDDMIAERDERIGDLREEIGILKGMIKMMERSQTVHTNGILKDEK